MVEAPFEVRVALMRFRAGAALCICAALAWWQALGCQDPSPDSAVTSACTPLADPALRITSEAVTVDGHFVVALGSGSAMRIFYGVASHLVEGTVTSTKPGCAFEIDFDVEGRSYVATLSPDPLRCMASSKLVSGDPDGPSAVALLSVTLVNGSPVAGGGSGDTGGAGDAGASNDAGDAGAAPVSPESLTFYCR